MHDSTAIQHRSLTERTVEQLTSDIMANAFGDDVLPAARVLSERYGVSILVMRDALGQLQARGLLDKRQGRRTRVVRPDHTAVSAALGFAARFDGVGVDELHECRSALEVRAAELAAQSDRQDKAEVLGPILETMATATSASEFNERDLALHLAIAELSGNRPIRIILAALADVIREALDVTYATVHSRKGAEGIEVALELHAQVVDAVVAGDPAAASRAMTEHFRYWHEGGT